MTKRMLDNYDSMFGGLPADSSKEFSIRADKIHVNERVIDQQIELAKRQKSWLRRVIKK